MARLTRGPRWVVPKRAMLAQARAVPGWTAHLATTSADTTWGETGSFELGLVNRYRSSSILIYIFSLNLEPDTSCGFISNEKKMEPDTNTNSKY